MASINKDKNGNWMIRVVRGKGRGAPRKTLRIGKQNQPYASEFARHVDRLNNALIGDYPVERATAEFVAGLPDTLRTKLATIGLVPPAHSTLRQQRTVGEFVAAYLTSRTDWKPSTLAKMRSAQADLVAHFSADRQLDSITEADAEAYRRYLRDRKSRRDKAEAAKLGDNTVRRACGLAKEIFNAAVKARLIDRNPFEVLKGTLVQANRERDYFVSQATAEGVIAACGHDLEWRLLFALSRYGGLRCPSEHLALTWGDVDLEAGKMVVHSPKTEHLTGKAFRIVPIFPELRPHLEAAREAFLDNFDPKAQSLSKQPVIRRYRRSNANLRTQLLRILKRAKIEPWPKLFQNLRSTRETELTDQGFPQHVVCAWLGNSPRVANKHYLQVTEDHFTKATAGGALLPALQQVAQGAATSAGSGNTEGQNPGEIDISRVLALLANGRCRNRTLSKNAGELGVCSESAPRALHSGTISDMVRSLPAAARLELLAALVGIDTTHGGT